MIRTALTRDEKFFEAEVRLSTYLPKVLRSTDKKRAGIAPLDRDSDGPSFSERSEESPASSWRKETATNHFVKFGSNSFGRNVKAYRNPIHGSLHNRRRGGLALTRGEMAYVGRIGERFSPTEKRVPVCGYLSQRSAREMSESPFAPSSRVCLLLPTVLVGSPLASTSSWGALIKASSSRQRTGHRLIRHRFDSGRDVE